MRTTTVEFFGDAVRVYQDTAGLRWINTVEMSGVLRLYQHSVAGLDISPVVLWEDCFAAGVWCSVEVRDA